jgi:3-keto-L-gulonate-6-phosphate decarboxylase
MKILMVHRPASKLNPKKQYLQVALNSTLEEARKIINDLPISDRIIVEAGTPLIKR